MRLFFLVLISSSLILFGCGKTMVTHYDKDGRITHTEEIAGEYISHTRARVDFKKSDSDRIIGQAGRISEVAKRVTETELPESTKAVLLDDSLEAIASLRPQEYAEGAPMTITEGVTKVFKTLANGTVLWFAISEAGDVLEAGLNNAKSDVHNGNHYEGDYVQATAQSNGEGSSSIDIDQSLTEETMLTTTVQRDVQNVMPDNSNPNWR